MKLIGIILLIGMMPTHVFSGEWALQYLADTGGSHLIRVSKEEAEVTEAFVQNDDAMVLGINCGRQNLDGLTPVNIGFTIGNGSPFLGRRADFLAAFDGEPEVKWGAATYAGGGYNGRIFGDVFAKLSLNKSVVIRDEISGFTARFPLENAAVTISDLRCEW
ncbi:hypothetical protein [Profundibacter sp.]|uniref:hypothetical protein n=1 Tax=Profundibacter sp. TaxID=3101071 RepID=UPI003D133BB5